MRLLAVAVFFTFLLVAALGAGIAAQQPFLMVGAFCSWTPACWLLGFALARAGVSITVHGGDFVPAAQSSNGRQRRRIPERERIEERLDAAAMAGRRLHRAVSASGEAEFLQVLHVELEDDRIG